MSETPLGDPGWGEVEAEGTGEPMMGIDLANEPDQTALIVANAEAFAASMKSVNEVLEGAVLKGQEAMADLADALLDPYGHGPCKQEDCSEPAVFPGGECARHTAEHTVLSEEEAKEQGEELARMVAKAREAETTAKTMANLAAFSAVKFEPVGKHSKGRTPSRKTDRGRRKLAQASRNHNRH